MVKLKGADRKQEYGEKNINKLNHRLTFIIIVPQIQISLELQEGIHLGGSIFLPPGPLNT